MSNENVLVLGHGSRAFLTVIRSLGRLGLNVHVAMFGDDDLALKSRYVAEQHLVRPDHWLADMLQILQAHRFELVLPCGDESMYPVQLHREELGRHAPVYAYDDALYRAAFNKYESTRLAAEEGVPVAQQVDITPASTADSILAELDLPLVLKPPSSIDESDPDVRCEVVRVRSATELEARLPDFTRFDTGAVAQENFNGIGVGVEVLADGGEIKVAFQHQRVHEPVEGGGSSYRRSVALAPDLLQATSRLMQRLDYTGVAMVEYKLNPATGEWIFIEINGRFWGSLPLAVASGVDFPAYLYRMRKQLPIEYPGSYKIGIHARSLLDDYHWFANNLRADHSDPTQATVPVKSVLAEVRHLLKGKERIDTLTLDDPLPAVYESGRLLKRILDKGLSSLGFLIDPVFLRKRRAARLVQTIRQADNLGFVCYGNICRSPFAARYAEQVLSGKAIWSAGFHPKDGRRVPAMGVSVARQMHIELAEERSAMVDDAMMNSADVVLVFDEKNMRQMQDSYPEHLHKVHYLADTTGALEREIEDPYGGSEARFLEAYERIRSALDAVSR